MTTSSSGQSINHISDALIAAPAFNLKVVAQIDTANFSNVLEALEWAVDLNGCENLAAVLVGSNEIGQSRNGMVTQVATIQLSDNMDITRKFLRDHCYGYASIRAVSMLKG